MEETGNKKDSLHWEWISDVVGGRQVTIDIEILWEMLGLKLIQGDKDHSRGTISDRVEGTHCMTPRDS